MDTFITSCRLVGDSYLGRLVSGVIGLFVLLPLITYKFGGGYTLGVYWFTIETYYLRRLGVLPIVVARIQSVRVGNVAGIGASYAEKVVLQNVGKSAALFVRVPDFDVETTDAGTTCSRIEGADVIQEGEAVPVESAGYLNDHTVVDTLAPHLKPSGQETYQVAIRYEDIAGGNSLRLHDHAVAAAAGGSGN
jgi:hypothetical protein